MSIEKMRASFVVFAADEGFCLDQREDDRFTDPDTAMAFEIWVQSRAAIEVELPDSSEFDSPADCHQAIRECREAIESLGLKVKS